MKNFTRFAFAIVLAALAGGAVAGARQQPRERQAKQQATQQTLSVRAANSAMDRWPSGNFAPAGSPPAWTHDQGVLLDGIHAVWINTVNRRDYSYIKHSVDPLLGAGGSLPTVKPGEHRLVDIALGRPLMLLYGVTLKKQYFNAAKELYQQLASQPRNVSGGFSASGNEPDVMTLDGIDEAEPFYAEYALTFHHPEAFADIARQFALMQEHARDSKTGLLREAWDESKQAHGAGKQTDDSAADSAQGMAWYMAALVDTIPSFPEGDPGRKQLIAILNEDAASIERYQSAKTGLWYHMLDKPGLVENSPDATSSCLFVYALAKGVRRGYLPERYDAVAVRAYKGARSYFATTGPGGSFALSPSSDPESVGAFILAGTEAEHIRSAKLGRGDTVMVDGWFNSQRLADPTGREIYFHYKWDDQSNPGYSLWGHAFRNFGARTTTLYAEPTFENLKQAQVYIVASPDNLDKNPHANFANAEDAAQIAAWVKAGGVFVIMENDTSFADLDHFNVISDKFGIHFNSVLR
ncbi:MAG: glycoside hydrolase family 88/105 protein, partial [Terracidiphilus sp.]